MYELTIKKGQSVTLTDIKGNILVSEGAKLIAETGTIIVDGAIKAKGNFFCQGNLQAQSLEVKRGKVEIIGSLELQQFALVRNDLDISGNFICPDVSVGNDLYVEVDFIATTVKVGTKLQIGGLAKIDVLKVGEAVKVYGRSELGSIAVGGSAKLLDECMIEELKVGRMLRVTCGTIQSIKLGGSFTASEKVKVNQLDVGGSVTLKDDALLGEAEIGKDLKCKANVDFKNLEIGGDFSVEGNARGDFLKVGGAIKCSGSLFCRKQLFISCSCKCDNELIAKVLEVGKEIDAPCIFTDYFRIKHRGVLVGTLIAKKAIIGSRATAEDIFGGTVLMEERSTAQNLSGEDLTLMDGVRISGELFYSSSLDAETSVVIKTAPKKVVKLPEPSPPCNKKINSYF